MVPAAAARRFVGSRVRSRLRRYRDYLSPPVVSVVVTAQEGRDHMAECLASLQQQTQRRVEIVIVDDTSASGADVGRPRRYRRIARLRVLRTELRGISAARNAGVENTRGRYLAFVDANDTLPPDALRILIRSLDRSGSDFALGAVHRVRVGRSSRPPWVSQVHEHDREAVTVEEFPAAMHNVGPSNRVYRRTFWVEQVGGYPEGTDFGESLVTATAFLRATTFDVLKAVTYQWHLRADPRSIVQRRAHREQLDDHLPMLDRTWQFVRSEASAGVTAAWLGGVLDAQVAPYIDNAGREDEAYRQRLGRGVRSFVDAADPAAWAYVRLHQRIRVWLASREQWRGLEQCTEFFRLDGPIPVTRVLDGRLYAEPPPLPELVEFPLALLELPRRQTKLLACIARTRWRDDTLVIEGWVFPRALDMTGVTPSIEAWLVDPGTKDRLPVVIESRTAPEANRWANQRHQNVESSGFTAHLATDRLPDWVSAGRGPGTRDRLWQLQLRVRAGGLDRTGGVRLVLLNGIGHRMPARDLADPHDRLRVVPMMHPQLGFVLQQRVELVRAVDLNVGPSGRVSGALSVLGQLPVPLVRVRATGAGGRVEAPLVVDGDGRVTFTLDLPVAGADRQDWTFLAIDERGRGYRASWPAEAEVGRVVGGGAGRARWSRSPRGYCDLATNVTAVHVTVVRLTESALVVEAGLVGLSADDLAEAVLVSGRTTVAVRTLEVSAPDRVRLEFPAVTSVWGGPERPLPSGGYRFQLPSRNLTFSPCDELLAALPIDTTTATHSCTVERSPGSAHLVVTLRAPLAEAERSRWAQNALARWYDETEFAPTESVLFQCNRGEFATDSQLAIHEELVRQGSPLQLLWGVSDYSVVLPEGATPLLIGSRAWYAAVGSSRYLCQNIDFDRFFRHRPYQRYLQTFHGYPFKSMGISLWRAQGKTESVIDAECERRTSAWDTLLVPSEPCVAMYRTEYRYGGEILVTGYPRNDSLVGPDVAAVRDRVRRQLELGDRTVVLYAPTWRDTAATGAWTAKLFDQLDLDELAERLGKKYAVLLRGHSYNLRDGGTGKSSAALDVTAYPEINDLILAADVAILDYSSLRFDWLITEKPVLFFVPDLDDYLSARTALFDFRSSAPGPLLTSTSEVIGALRGLPTVSEEFAASRRGFNATFNRLHDGRAARRVVDAFFIDEVSSG